MQIAIRSFLWVPSAYGEPGVPAFQVDVVETAETMEEAAAIGGLTRLRQALNVAQAADLGITIETIGAAFSTDLAAALDRALAARDAALAQLAALDG
ncbi:hypothetical protein L2U69_12495 [Zavarzinia compransoris]|uniref:hypothetical protein n=1 Tax=Zavarzinia marina TaxID=2911065 RepID=UPI001F20585B|nr:hypothetical protein [Zavarzinia marina]MCF4166465.1 hypothetical protein [Zavarzinia marina]